MCLRNFYAKNPTGVYSSEENTGYLICIFTNLVFIGIISPAYGYFLFRTLNHSCGPFTKYHSAIDPIFNSTEVFNV